MSSKAKTTGRKEDGKPALVPKLRFPEFRDAPEWESKPMGEVYSFKGNNSLSRDQLNYENGSVKNIHYGDIHTKFSTLFDITKETVPFINPSESLDSFSPENNCVEGDMIFADASEDLEDIGKSIEIVYLNGERIVSGQHTILARPNGDNLVVGFGAYLFKSRYANNPDDIPAFEKQMRRKTHYVIQPPHLWNSIANLARTQNAELLNTLQAGFKYIETESFESTFQGLFSEINLGSDKLGRTYADRNAKLCTIIQKIAEGLAEFTDEHIAKIIETYKTRQPEDRYARRVEMAEIEKNDFNLNISRYISTATAEAEIDLAATHNKLVEVEKTILSAMEKHNQFLKELGLPPLTSTQNRRA